MGAPAPAEQRDLAQVVVDAFQGVTDEVDVILPVVEGAVPPSLRGVLYRNGPGRLRVHDLQLTHPFDGDGMVSRFAFANGQVRYRNRYVRTDEYLAEARAGRALYRNFGTNLPGGIWANLLGFKFKNPANTSVLAHAGRLLALWEGGLPHALDPETLETLGRYDFAGALRSVGLARVLAPEPPFAAHPRRCARTGEVWSFGLQVAPRPTLWIYRIDVRGELVETRRIRLPAMSFMHDFVLTERFAVFFMTPVTFDVARALIGFASPVQSIRRAPGGTVALLVPRNGGPERRIPLGSGFFLFHFFNGFSDGATIVVDGCRMADFPGGTVDLSDVTAVREVGLDPGYPTRWRINVETESVDECKVSNVAMELPTIDPRRVAIRHEVGYATARLRPGPPFYTGLARVDFDTGEVDTVDLAPDLPGEPMFLPLSGNEAHAGGVLATVVYRAAERVSELQLRVPETLALIARARLPHAMPPGFHGQYVPA